MQSNFEFFIPTVIVIDMTANIRRVAVYEIGMGRRTYRILKGLTQKLPFMVFQKLFDVGDLVYDFVI